MGLESRGGLQRKHGNGINCVVVDSQQLNSLTNNMTIVWLAGNKVFAGSDGPLVYLQA